jgi:tripartite-type tricarboxylate transporter receptor subunit TctC
VPHAIILTNKVEAKSIPELIALSKQRPVTLGTSGIGSATHMTLERFKHATGANLTHVPYRGGGALMPDVIGGNIDGAMTEFSSALSLHKGGKAHIIAIAAMKRSQLALDIATFGESGVKNFTAQSYIGIVAPSKTPADIIARIENSVQKGMAQGTPAAERLVSLGSELATPEQMSAKGFAAFIREDYEAMREAAKLAGIVPS